MAAKTSKTTPATKKAAAKKTAAKAAPKAAKPSAPAPKPAPKAPAPKAVQATPKAPSPKAAAEVFKRPEKEGPCAQLWALFDKLQAKLPKGELLPVATAKEAAAKLELHPTTCTIQFYHWRRNLGVRGRGSKQKVG